MPVPPTTDADTAGYAIYHDLSVAAAPARVFAAVAEPAHLVNWWPQRCTGTPALGECYNFFFTPEYDWYGQVITCEPGRAFHIKMTQADTDWDPTAFGFDLAPNGEDQTRLQFFHRGWRDGNDHFRHSSYCWAMLLHGLQDYVERGVVVPFARRA